MKYFLSIIVFLLSVSTNLLAQPLPVRKEVNAMDEQKRRQGFWYVEVPARVGEFGYTEFGNYVNNRKEGVWYKLDEYGRLKSIENFRFGVLHGSSEYYDKGNLVLRGTYRGLDPDKEFDTVQVIDPDTYEEFSVVVRTDAGSLKHGAFRYYHPVYGHLMKIEEYQVDSLIYTRQFHMNAVPDSVVKKNYQNQLPHVKDPKGRKGQVNNPRSSLIK